MEGAAPAALIGRELEFAVAAWLRLCGGLWSAGGTLAVPGSAVAQARDPPRSG
jgi:hypothetical protein